MIFWGPPGVGKTTLARIIASTTNANFSSFSAVLSGVKEIKEVVAKARDQLKYYRKKTILFIDEIHRFNKAQQDALLPHVEDGTLILIGATTENPSFEVISALLSRCRVYILNLLSEAEIASILRRALQDEDRGIERLGVKATGEAIDFLSAFSHGDARIALNALEVAALDVHSRKGEKEISIELAKEALQKKALHYDKSGEEHYNLISALHKSLRDSDPDGALYWLGRMIEAGEDPLYIARRMVRFASEDIGNADPQALPLAVAAMQAFHFVGLPEGDLALAQAAVYLALAPKSNSIYSAFSHVKKEIKNSGALPVPLHLRNPVTSLMKEKDYGKGYQYAHNYENHLVDQQHLPDGIHGRRFYHPTDLGFETELGNRIKRNEELKKKKKRE
jgi:putative ATPase